MVDLGIGTILADFHNTGSLPDDKGRLKSFGDEYTILLAVALSM